MALPVALQVYSVRNDAKEDLFATLKKIKAMGYDGVEFAGLYGHTAQEVKSMCSDTGLVPVSAHVPLVDMIKDPSGTFDAYAEIGCKYVAVPYLVPAHRPGTEYFPVILEFIQLLGKEAKKHGITLLYHNHDFEFVKLNGTYGLDVIYSTVPAEFLKTELDVCWVNVGGEDPSAYIRKYAGRSPVVHLKDFHGEKSENMYELIGFNTPAPKRPGNFEFRPLGSGLNDFPSILKASCDAGAQWLVVEQDSPSMGLSALECAEKSRAYLRTLGY